MTYNFLASGFAFKLIFSEIKQPNWRQYMKVHAAKLQELQEQLKTIIKEVQAGTLGKMEAAERILELREAIDEILKKIASPNSNKEV